VKICFFGGTFDPPHIGHLIIAQSIMEWGSFDKIVFIPSSKSPHKMNNISSEIHRINMLKLIIKNKIFFQLSLIDIERVGVTYTIDTIRELKKKYISQEKIFILIGSDLILDFEKWKDYKLILNECQIIVAPRPRFVIENIPQKILSKIIIADIPMFDISSLEIKNRINKGLPINYFVTKQVKDYIFSENLFNGT